MCAISTPTTYASSSDGRSAAVPEALRLDVLETMLRQRLATQPLPKGTRCYIYIAHGFGSGIKSRLPGYPIVVGSGRISSVPPRQRWYRLDIREISERTATVVIEDAKSFKVARLRRVDDRWIVVSEKPYYLT